MKELRLKYADKNLPSLHSLEDKIKTCGWNASLFRKKVDFDYQTLSVVSLFHHKRWATKTQIDCALITMRARYPHK